VYLGIINGQLTSSSAIKDFLALTDSPSQDYLQHCRLPERIQGRVLGRVREEGKTHRFSEIFFSVISENRDFLKSYVNLYVRFRLRN